MKSLLETILSRKLHDPKVVIYNWLDEHEIKNYTLNDRGEVDVDGGVDLRKKGLKEFPSFIQFGIVKGFFDCSYNNLTSLKGAPKEVGSKFDCRYNELISLEESPKEVGEDFYCQGNNLTTLKGAPNRVNGYFNCTFNNLITLEGAPSEVGRDFDCYSNNLTTLKGAPNRVKGYFNCSINSTQFTKDDVKKVCIAKKIIV